MKCPYCLLEMQKGNIHGQKYSLSWLPEDEDPPFFVFTQKGIPLGERSIFQTPKVQAFYCPFCKKIMVDLKNEEHN